MAREIARSSTGRPLTKRYWKRRVGKVTAPRVRSRRSLSGPARASKTSSSPSVSFPKTCRMRAAAVHRRPAPPGSRGVAERSENATAGLTSAARVTAAATARASASGRRQELAAGGGALEKALDQDVGSPRARGRLLRRRAPPYSRRSRIASGRRAVGRRERQPSRPTRSREAPPRGTRSFRPAGDLRRR